MGGYAEDEEEPERKGFNFFGTDISKIPCFKHSFMYAIGSGMVTGVAYNLAFSKSPYKLAFGVYTSVLFGYWFVCRYDYRLVLIPGACLCLKTRCCRMREAEMKKIRHAMRNYTQLEGTTEAEKWAEQAHIDKKTEIRNFRSDISPPEQS